MGFFATDCCVTHTLLLLQPTALQLPFVHVLLRILHCLRGTADRHTARPTLCVPGWQHDVGSVKVCAWQFTGHIQDSGLDRWQPGRLLRPPPNVQPCALQLVVQRLSRLPTLQNVTKCNQQQGTHNELLQIQPIL